MASLMVEADIIANWSAVNPEISICCITYNHERFIAEAIESFLSQKCNVPFEVIIGEDCSSDSTCEVIKKYRDDYPNIIRLITSDENVGGHKNFNRVIDSAKGKFISICEGDDFFIDEFKLQKAYDYMLLNSDVSMLFTPALKVEETVLTEKVRNRYTEDQINQIDLKWVLKKGGGFYPTPTSFFKAEVLKERPSWFYKHCTGDYPMAISAILRGSIGYIDDVSACYRVNAGSISNPVFCTKDQAQQKFIANRDVNLVFFESICQDGLLTKKMFTYLRAKEEYIYYAKLLASGYGVSSLLGVLRIRGSIYFKLRLILKAAVIYFGLRF